jgi:hypothetical protein
VSGGWLGPGELGGGEFVDVVSVGEGGCISCGERGSPRVVGGGERIVEMDMALRGERDIDIFDGLGWVDEVFECWINSCLVSKN